MQLLLLKLLITIGLIGFVLPANAAAATLWLKDPITDNYKASYNANPQQVELRTWFAMDEIVLDGTTWRPSYPTAISVFSSSTINVNTDDGHQGQLTVQAVSGSISSLMWRVDPINAPSSGRWGLLAMLSSREALKADPVLLRLQFSGDDSVVGSGAVEYRYDPKLANVAPSNIEYNGPGGRWYVGPVPTRTQEEALPATKPLLPATEIVMRPRIIHVSLPKRTTSRIVTLIVRGRAGAADAPITHIRIRVGSKSAWKRWIPTRSRYTITLPRGVTKHTISVQLRDRYGIASPTASRSIVCICM